MKSEIFFYNNKGNEWETLEKIFRNTNNKTRFITTSIALNQFFNERGINSIVLDEKIPIRGEKAFEVYAESKKILEQYRSAFKEIKINGIELFEGYSYHFLRQLELIIKIKKILEENQDVIFVFENYRDSYFTMLKIAEDLGYEKNVKINFVNGDKIDKISEEEFRNNFENKNILDSKSFGFVKNSFKEKNSLEKLKIGMNLLKRTSSYGIKNISKKIEANQDFHSILNQINKKIRSNKFEKDLFFITGTREDLFFKPMKKILERFVSENINVKIFTIDLATSIVLDKQKIEHFNLFEEYRILLKIYKNSEEGRNIEAKTNHAINENESILGINQLSTYIISQNLRSAVIILMLEQIFQQVKLRSIYPVADGEILENLAIQYARKKNLRNITLLPGIFDAFPYFLDWFHADKICVGGEKDADSMIQLGYSKNRIVITGNPRYDFIKKLDSKNSKHILDEKFRIDSKKKLIVIARGRWEKNDEVWMPKLIKFCNKYDMEVIIKIHPLYKTKSQGLSEEKIRKIKESCPNEKFLITYDEDLYLLIAAADLVLIHESSTVGVDASLIGKPIIAVDFLNEDTGFETKYHEYNAAKIVKKYQNLEKILFEILMERKYLDELEQGRKKIAQLYNYKNDGNAVNRIFDLFTKIN